MTIDASTIVAGVATTLITGWIAWASLTLVDTQRKVDIVEYKVDAIAMPVQELFDKASK